MAAWSDEKVTKTVLVTGANGALGKALIKKLQQEECNIFAVSRKPIPNISTIICDLFDYKDLDLNQVEGDIDCIFHLAAMMPNHTQNCLSDFMRTNSEAVMHLIEKANQNKVTNFVYASSASVIGMPAYIPQDDKHPLKPIHNYSISKLGGELACLTGQNSGMKVAILRLASLYGPAMDKNTVLPFFVDCAHNKKKITLYGSGSRSQDFVHLDDVAQAMWRAFEHDASATYCIGSGQTTTMLGLAETIASIVSNVEVEFSEQDDSQEGVVWHSDISAAQSDFKYDPQISLKEGLARYLDDFQRMQDRKRG